MTIGCELFVDSIVCTDSYSVSLQFKQLENLGYSGFAFGFFEEDVHFVSTSSATPCSHPKVIQFLISLITASECVN